MFYVTSWMEAIFNASLWPRFFHMALASFLTAGFVVAGVSAWYLLRNRAVEMNRKALGMTVVLLAIIAPAQLVVGDIHGLNTFEHQPAKVAAMEGVWETQSGAPLLLFAIPSASAERNYLEIGIPKMASLILTHEMDGVVPGLKEWAPEDRPPVATVFWSFRIMVGIGMLMIAVSVIALVQRLRGRLFESTRLLRVFTWMIPLPFVAVLAGWFVTEVGRQPYLVYGILRLADGVTPSLTGGMALFTLIGYIVVYAAVFTAGLYYLVRLIQAGPDAPETHTTEPGGRPKRPLSAVGTDFDDAAPQGAGR
ncbi:MAG: cytochrome ubiquinol oxidase subunit I, partial [Ectothiorhodospiraceae bacterium]|nr:cytochrome ubiquinol oxidase subunit I [Ectothiorhodospiraceae bacterium]